MLYLQVVAIFFLTNIRPAYSLDMKPAEIVSLLSHQNYKEAIRIMEAQIRSSKVSREQKGYYAFLLHQIPLKVPMKGKRHRYAYMAARWSSQLSKKDKLNLWVAAGDGFFNEGTIKTAEICYKKALTVIKGIDDKKQLSYIQYKLAWVYINQKRWKDSFHLLVKAVKGKPGSFEEDILFDIGKIWVESQYFENKIPFEGLLNVKSDTGNLKEPIIRGMLNGLQRSSQKGLEDFVPVVSKNTAISTQLLSHFISSKEVLPLFPSCHLLPWFKNSNLSALNSEYVFPVLNACSQSLLINETRKPTKESLKNIAYLYEQFQRTGAQHWPLSLIYKRLGQKRKACNEITFYTVDALNNFKREQDTMEKVISETIRLCENTDISSDRGHALVRYILLSRSLANAYKNGESYFEKLIFTLLNLKTFRPYTKEYMLKASKAWKQKSLLPELIIADNKQYNSSEIEKFLNRFAEIPLSSDYLPLLLITDFEVYVLEKWIPLPAVKSYEYISPWLKKALSNELSNFKKRLVVNKLIRYFPTHKRNQSHAANFLAFYYLEKESVSEIFNQWNKVAQVFRKKQLAKKLVEQALYNESSNCNPILSGYSFKRVKNFPVLKFIYQSCQLLQSKELNSLSYLKVPSVLRSSSLAWDFSLLNRVHRKTVYLKKNLSQIHNKTVPMIMDLKNMVTHCQNRSWNIEKMKNRSRSLLNTQIVLFESELTKMADTSPYGAKYNELRKIIQKWK